MLIHTRNKIFNELYAKLLKKFNGSFVGHRYDLVHACFHAGYKLGWQQARKRYDKRI